MFIGMYGLVSFLLRFVWTCVLNHEMVVMFNALVGS